MSTSRSGQTLVVREGAKRLQWVRTVEGWRLEGMWPGPADQRVVSQHLGTGAPVLVVLEEQPAVVTALRDELVEVPPYLRALYQCDEYVDLEVPFLDWLPADVRRRGEQFAAYVQRLLAVTPRWSLPQLLFAPDVAAGHQVQFVARTPACRVLDDRLLDQAVEHAFAGVYVAVEGAA